MANYKSRKSKKNTIRERLLIICEGEKTEPNYFKSFIKDIKNAILEVDVIGEGFNTLSLIERALTLKENAANDTKKGAYNQVWCVFDRDSFPPDAFDNAINKAMANKIRVAWSNECFEIWYMLHFHYYNTRLSRRDYFPILSGLLKEEYKKNDIAIYSKLKDKQKDAVKFAMKLLAYHKNTPNHAKNPSTTVHLLVSELNRYKNK